MESGIYYGVEPVAGNHYGANQYGAELSAYPHRWEKRLPATIKVRVLGIDADGKPFHQQATTTDISPSGAHITGLLAKLNKDDVVGVRSEGGKHRFKVTWVKKNRDGTHQVGLRCIEKGASPWLEHLSPRGRGDKERRGDDRYACTGSVCLRSAALSAPIWANLRDVSATGCYVHSVKTLPVGEMLSGQFTLQNTQINAIVEVRSDTPGEGMGLLWCDVGCDGKGKLNRVLKELAAKHAGPESGKDEAASHLNKVHQLLVAVRERLENTDVSVHSETLVHLGAAHEKLTAALRSVQP